MRHPTINNEHLRPEERLIFALDVGTQDQAIQLIDELSETINFFKVGLQLFMSTGLQVVEQLVKRNLNVFLDMKMDDVQETIRSSVEVVSQLGVKFLTIHGNKMTAEAAGEGRGDRELKILSLTLLTSLDEQDLRDLFLVGPEDRFRFKTLEDYVLWRAEQAMKHGCDGLITSGQNVGLLKKNLSQYNPILVCPGIRPKEDYQDGHKRAVAPFDAIANGADYLVVGRPIKNAKDRVAKARSIIDDIRQASRRITTFSHNRQP